MKAKLIDKNVSGLTHGKIYDVVQSPTFPQSYVVVNDDGMRIEYWKCRFKIVDPIKEKTAEIKETEARLAVLKKELEDLQTPQVGQKYQHKHNPNKYILALWRGLYVLVCYEGPDCGRFYDKMANSPSAAFSGNEYVFTLIEE